MAILIAEGFHDHEFWYPYYRFKEEGAEVVVGGVKAGIIYGEGRHGTDGLPARVEYTVEEVADLALDALYLPGGMYCPRTLRAHEPTLELVRDCMAKSLPMAAICHGSWILVSAGVAKDRKISCPRDMSVDVENAGGTYVVDPCVRDGNIFTAVLFRYLPEQFRELIPAIVLSRRSHPSRNLCEPSTFRQEE